MSIHFHVLSVVGYYYNHNFKVRNIITKEVFFVLFFIKSDGK